MKLPTKALTKTAVHLLLVGWALYSILPFIWASIGSTQVQRDAVARSPRFIPQFLVDNNLFFGVLIAVLVMLFIGWQMRSRPGGVGARQGVALGIIGALILIVFIALPALVGKQQLYEPTTDNFRDLWLSGSVDNFGVISLIFVLLVVGIIALLANADRLHIPKSAVYFGATALFVAILFLLPQFVKFAEFYNFFLNSVIITVGTVIISISIGCLAGYGLARYSGIAGVVILLVALAFRALPRIAFVLPYYFFAKLTNLYDTYFLLITIMVAINQPFTIWMLRSFFMEIPRDLEEAAMIDGCNRLTAFTRVIIPVVWPGIITTGLFTVLLAYNEFLTVRLLTSTNWTLPVGIARFTSGEDTRYIPLSNASAVSITIPIVIIVIFFQRYLVKGLVGGAVKG